MTLDATFWVTISFLIFLGILFYFKIPQKIKETLEQNISNIKNQIIEAEKLKEVAKNILTEHEKKISNSKKEVAEMVNMANEEAEKNVIRTNNEFHKLIGDILYHVIIAQSEDGSIEPDNRTDDAEQFSH